MPGLIVVLRGKGSAPDPANGGRGPQRMLRLFQDPLMTGETTAAGVCQFADVPTAEFSLLVEKAGFVSEWTRGDDEDAQRRSHRE